MTQEYLNKKIQQLKAGQQIIASDEDMEKLEKIFSNLFSLPNPKRIGILDRYIVKTSPFYDKNSGRIIHY